MAIRPPRPLPSSQDSAWPSGRRLPASIPCSPRSTHSKPSSPIYWSRSRWRIDLARLVVASLARLLHLHHGRLGLFCTCQWGCWSWFSSRSSLGRRASLSSPKLSARPSVCEGKAIVELVGQERSQWVGFWAVKSPYPDLLRSHCFLITRLLDWLPADRTSGVRIVVRRSVDEGKSVIKCDGLLISCKAALAPEGSVLLLAK